MPSRKRLQGKLRKVKALRVNANANANAGCLQCRHGCEPISVNHVCFRFVEKFVLEMKSKLAFDIQSVLEDLMDVFKMMKNNNDFTGIWKNEAHLKMLSPLFTFVGTRLLLQHNYDMAVGAAMAVLFSQHKFDEGKVLAHGTRSRNLIRDLNHGCLAVDSARFFTKRIPCQCLKKLYTSIKSEPKMSRCKQCGVRKERKLLFLCGKCRWTHYCSVECQQVKSCTYDAWVLYICLPSLIILSLPYSILYPTQTVGLP